MYYQWTDFGITPVKTEEPQNVDVAIVGGGPVGLSLGVALQKQGIDVVILEKQTQVSDGSRAITMNRDTLAFLARLGIADDFMERAQERQRSIVFQGDEELWRTTYSKEEHERWPSLALLQQCWIEDILLKKLLSFTPDAIRWGHEVTAADQNIDHATLSVQAGDQTYDISAKIVVATDGARGQVRRSLDLQYQNVIPQRGADTNFVICDFIMDYELESGRRLFIGPDYASDSVTLFHSQPLGVWRLDYEVPAGMTPEEASSPEAARERVTTHLAMMGIEATPELKWVTTYRAMGRTLDRYRHGRIVFAGDAAHQSPIFGGRGLNMGFGDINALAWRVPEALTDNMDVLDDYSDERTFVVRRTLQALTPVCMFMTSADLQSRILRNQVMELLPKAPALKELIDGHNATQVLAFPVGDEIYQPLREIIVESPDLGTRYLSELLPAGHFSITLVSLDGNSDGQARLSITDRTTDYSFEVHAHPQMVEERLGLSLGNLLVGRPDRMVTTHNVDSESIEGIPLTKLQQSFISLSAELAESDAESLDTEEIRTKLLVAATNAMDGIAA